MNKTDALNNNWRKVATTIYRKPVDSKIFGTVEIDVTEVEEYISRKRKEGLKITMTHILTLTIARAIATEVPQFNAYVRLGKIVPRKTVGATVTVLMPGLQMGSVLIRNADKVTLRELVDEISAKINRTRKGDEQNTGESKNMLSSVPWPFRKWIYKLYKMVTINWGLPMPILNVNAESFGSFVVSNIGTLGLDMGIPALLPSSNVSIVIIQGGISLKPTVYKGEVVPRRIMSVGAAIDHRIADASHGGILFRYIKQVFKNPEILESKPTSKS
jgi:pyruvate/2-oxoglutarate dehydrogenase complex dihydrolipoamide acyltransferase (E2) component